jgi:hypothetical protein
VKTRNFPDFGGPSPLAHTEIVESRRSSEEKFLEQNFIRSFHTDWTLSRHSQVGEVWPTANPKAAIARNAGAVSRQPTAAPRLPPCRRHPSLTYSTDTPDTTPARPAAAIPSDAPGSLSCQLSEHLEIRAEVWDFSRLRGGIPANTASKRRLTTVG